MRYFRRQTTKLKSQMTVWDIGSAPSKEKKEGERVTTKIFPRAFQPDEEASPEVGQPKRPWSAWETKCGGKGLTRTRDSSSSIYQNPRWKSNPNIRDSLFEHRRVFLRPIFIAILSPTWDSSVHKNTRFAIRKISRSKPVISFEIIFLALVPSRNRIALWAWSRGSRMRGRMKGKNGRKKRKGRAIVSRERLPISAVLQLRARKNALCIVASILRAAIIKSAIQFPSQREPTVTREGLESSWRFHLGILRRD